MSEKGYDSQIPGEHKHGIETQGKLAGHDANDTDGREVRKDIVESEDEDESHVLNISQVDTPKEKLLERLKESRFDVEEKDDKIIINDKVEVTFDTLLATVKYFDEDYGQKFPRMMTENIFMEIEARLPLPLK